MVKVSILMPVYNAGRFVKQAVQSVLGQTYGDFELICVDDKSTDNSLEILNQFAEADSRVVVIKHSSNLGVGYTRDECINKAQGQYFLFVDADDFVEPDTIQTCLDRAESTKADATLFRLDVVADPLVDYPMDPPKLCSRYCFYLWDKVFNHQNIADSIFQLGASINAAFIKTEFAKNSKLSCGNHRIWDSQYLINIALIKANRIALLNKTLCHARWWHGANLTQTSLGNPRRYYQALLDFKHQLEQTVVIDTVSHSYVNLVSRVLADELKAQVDFVAYTDTAKFYRVYGFDALGILGYQESYYNDPTVHKRIRQIVMGDVYNTQEKLIKDLETQKKNLTAANKQLTKWLNQLRKPDLDLLKRYTNKITGSIKAKLPVLNKHNTSASTQSMNASTGYRFLCLCNQILAPAAAECSTDESSQKQNLIASLESLKNEVREATIYGQKAISASNKTYLYYLNKLISLLRQLDTTDIELAQQIETLKQQAANNTQTRVKLVFNLEADQTFPAFESVFTAAVNDSRFDAEIVYAPLGSGVENWKNTSAPLYTQDGPIQTRQKSEYNMFAQSPDILFTARPHLNLNTGPLFLTQQEVFEITPPLSSGFRTVYLPYAFFDTISETAINFGYQHTIHPVAWRNIAYSEQIFDNYKKFSELEGQNAILLGAPRFDISSGINEFRQDELTAKYREFINGRRTLLWNTHYGHTGANIKPFMTYIKQVLDYFTNHPELVLFWRPHPKMFGSMVIKDLMTQQEVDDLLLQTEQSPNIIIDQSKDYINGFALSDVMLTDGDSSLPYEYIATKKPVYIRFVYGGSESWAEQKYKNHIPILYYRSFDSATLNEHLDMFARAEDPQKPERLAKAPRFIYNNDGQTGQRVLGYIYDELLKAEEDLVKEAFEQRGAQGIPDAVKTNHSNIDIAKSQNELAFAIYKDSYCLDKQTWQNTIELSKDTNQNDKLDAVIHLYNNPEQLSKFDQVQLFSDRHKPHYYLDIEDRHLRLIFLDSYDPDFEQPFGYSKYCIDWLRCIMSNTPRARRVIVFSSAPPFAVDQGGKNELRGQNELMEVLTPESHRILAFVHADSQIFNASNTQPFPVLIAKESCSVMLANPIMDTVQLLTSSASQGYRYSSGV